MSVINGLKSLGAYFAESIHYDNSKSGLAATNVNSAIDEISSLNRMYKFDRLLKASKWEGIKAPYTYEIDIDILKEEDYLLVYPGESLTRTQFAVMANAVIQAEGETEGKLLLKAYGEKPIIDLPVIIAVGKLIAIPAVDSHFVTYDPSEESKLTSTNVHDALDELASRLQHSNIERVHLNETLDAGKWSGIKAPFTYTIQTDKVTISSEVSVSPVFDMTTDQYDELSHAAIVTGKTDDGKIILKAYGNKPVINIPVNILIVNY